jgi:outer membrane protein TolC
MDTYAKRNREREKTAAYLAINRVTELDLRQADLDRDKALQELENARGQLELEKKNLLLLTGLALKNDFQVSDVPVPVLPDVKLEEAVTQAYNKRYELKQANLGLAVSEIQAKLTASKSAAVVKGVMKIGWDRSWLDRKDAGSFSAGVEISLPVYDSGLAEANRQTARNQLDICRLQQEQIRQNIALEVQKALWELNSMYHSLELVQRDKEQLVARQELAEARFQQGLISRLEVLDANLALTKGETDLLEAKNNYQLAVLKFRRTIGD